MKMQLNAGTPLRRVHCNAFSLALLMLGFINGNIQMVTTTPVLQITNNNNISSVYFYELLHAHNVSNGEHLKLLLRGHQPIVIMTPEDDRDEKLNLTAITWAHAVNSQRELDEVLDSDIDMIEADIVLGKLNNIGPDLPVMAHPPANSSDISLFEFLSRILLHNEAHPDDIKGVKLDFKSIEVFEGSLGILSSMVPLMSYPVWLNADIVRGPVNQTNTVPVDPERFLAGCALFEKAVLSIGWTTRWGADYTEGAYSTEEINEMIEVIKSNNVPSTGQPITFPVRAGIAANSQDQLHELVRAVNDTNESSITIWSSANDYVDVDKLRQLIYSFGFDRVYLDVPDELANRLNLTSEGSDGAVALKVPSLFSFSVVSACLVLASWWLKRAQL